MAQKASGGREQGYTGGRVKAVNQGTRGQPPRRRTRLCTPSGIKTGDGPGATGRAGPPCTGAYRCTAPLAVATAARRVPRSKARDKKHDRGMKPTTPCATGPSQEKFYGAFAPGRGPARVGPVASTSPTWIVRAEKLGGLPDNQISPDAGNHDFG